jgi:hypothetical protein
LRDLPQQKIPRELCGGGDPAIFLCSHVPMKRVFDGTDQENFKNTRRKETDQGKFKKRKKERMKERKRRDFDAHTWRFPYSCVLHWSRTPPFPLGLLPSFNSSLRRTHSNGIFVIFINSFKWILGFYHGTNLTYHEFRPFSLPCTLQ